jgi:predicted site-specific integrase-resolvase
VLCPINPRPGDGRISREEAAALACVKPDTISAWITRGYITDVRREGKRVWLNAREIIEAEHRLHAAERERMGRVLGAAERPAA